MSPFLLVCRGSVTGAAFDIRGHRWRLASGVDDDGKRKREDSSS